MFLADLAYNKRLSFQIENLELIEVWIWDLPEDVKQAYDEMLLMNDDEFISVDSSNYEGYESANL